MHGLGDNIRQRAIVRQLMERHEVWLESSWVSVYHDLIGDGLQVIRKDSRLRTQAKNAVREAVWFSKLRPPPSAKHVRVWYPPAEVRKRGSVLAAMCASAGLDVAGADFRLPIPSGWLAKVTPWLRRWGYSGTKPMMVYRPLVDRPSDWTGCNARNPDHAAYAALYRSIRDQFFVVSVADLVPKVEWIVGEHVEADAVVHRGELEFEALAALTSLSGLVFCSPGFAAVLAQAVGTPVACIFGGYERSSFFFAGAKNAPVLGIDPIHPCECFRHDHDCRKTIDLPAATERLAVFAEGAVERYLTAREVRSVRSPYPVCQ
jgi:hypothetical protein